MMGDPLGSSRLSSQKQNREGVVGAESGQYRATVVERARDVVDPGSGCDKECHTPKRKRLQNLMSISLNRKKKSIQNYKILKPISYANLLEQ